MAFNPRVDEFPQLEEILRDAQAVPFSLAEVDQETMGSGYGIGEDAQNVTQGQEDGVGVGSDEQDAADDNGQGIVVPVMPRLGQNEEMHKTLDAGFDSFYKPRRQLDIENDDFGDVIDKQSEYAQQVFDALRTKPAQTSTAQDEMTAKFVKILDRFNDFEDAKSSVVNISVMIVKAVIHLHSNGDHLYRHQFMALKPLFGDYTMKAAGRLSTICNILRDNKKIAMDIMSGADKITSFVAAPLGAVGLKDAYKISNDFRALAAKNAKAELKALKEAEEEAADAELEARLEDEVSQEAIEAILQDQHVGRKRKRGHEGGL